MTLKEFLKKCQYQLYMITVQDDEHSEANETDNLFYGFIEDVPEEFDERELDCWGLNSNPCTGNPEAWVWLR